ncbi:MAG: hypothetical protein AAF787_11170 [Chloroflexota bacterium]
MPMKIGWLVPEKVIYFQMAEKVTAAELLSDPTPTISRMEASSEPLIHCVFDYTIATDIPGLNVFAQSEFPRHPKFGWSVDFAHPSPVTRFILKTTGALFNLKTRSLNTYDEAIAFLQELDPAIPSDVTIDDVQWYLEIIGNEQHDLTGATS